MAGRFSVEAIFKAVDRITAPVTRMQNRVGKFTRGMEKNLRRVNRQVDKVTGAMRRGAGNVLKFGGAMLGAVGGATAVALQKTADAADALAKQSRRLQFPIEDLQEWKFVADQSGVSNELLDKSLGAFTKRLGEAKAGTGPLTAGLKKINPQLLAQLNQTENVADAFEIYIDAMRGAESATEKAALANAAFSRAGLDLVNISDNSTQAIKALRLEQRRNGNITQQQAEAAEAYNDAVNSLKKSLTGLLHGVLLPMMPALIETLRQWREWIVANRELVQERVLRFVTDLKERIFSLVRGVVDFSQKYDLADKLSASLDVMGKFGSFLSENGGLVLKITAGVVAFAVVLKTLIAVMTLVNLVIAANPITWIILGIVALIAAIVALVAIIVKNWDTIVGFFTDIWDDAKDKIAQFVGWISAQAEVIAKAWEPIKEFFGGLWGGVVGIFDNALGRITQIVDVVKGKATAIIDTISSIGSGVASFFGFGSDDEDDRSGGQSPQVVSPEDRVARSIEEQRTTSTAEVTIRDETGRAEVTGGKLGNGLTLSNSGAF